MYAIRSYYGLEDETPRPAKASGESAQDNVVALDRNNFVQHTLYEVIRFPQMAKQAGLNR